MTALARPLLPWLRRFALWLFALWCLFPICWLASMSLKQPVDAIARRPRFLFTPVWTNYAAVLRSSDVWGYFGNSLAVALASTAPALALGVPTAYVIAHVALNLSIVTWLMKGFFEDLPVELEEAALMDGASAFQAFRRICLPVALPGVLAVAILAPVLAFVFVFQHQLVRGLTLGATK